MHLAIPRPPADDEYGPPAELTGLLAHLDTVYGFALTLTGDAEHAEMLTEEVFASVHDDLWSTLGGHALRERLLARCVTAFATSGARERTRSASVPVTETQKLHAMLRELPWNERAAISLIDQLGLSYAEGAAVLGTTVNRFRTLLHHGRGVLFDAYRAGAR